MSTAGTRAGIELGDGYGGARVDSEGLPMMSAGWGADARTKEAQARELIKSLRAAQAAERAARMRVESIVQDLRVLGASWALIAAAVGVTRAAATKRFGRRELT